MRINDIVKHKNGEIIKITEIDCRNSEKTIIVYIRGLIYPLYNKHIFCSIEDIAEEYYPTEQELLEQCKKYIDTTKEYVRCAACGDLHEKNETIKHNDKYYCSDCAEDEFYYFCDICCEKHLKTDLIGVSEKPLFGADEEVREHHICKECFNNHHKKDIFWCDYHKMYEFQYNNESYPFADGKCFEAREEIARKERLELLEKIGIKEGGEI